MDQPTSLLETQSMIFGIEGTLLESYTPIFSTELSGSNWITGGALGLEGSVQATLFCIVASIILLYLSKKTKDSKWLKFKGNNR